MKCPKTLMVFAATFAVLLSACQSIATMQVPGRAGTLLLIGGGLEDDARSVYERLLQLAGASGKARIVIATAATGDQDIEVADKSEALRCWDANIAIDVIRRETSTMDTVAAIDGATALLFTGGDQKRITARYRPDDHETPEWLAMQRLLARGGVIAGCSAGDAMMGDIMLLSGNSARALGIAPTPPEGGEAQTAELGPQIGPGMRFVPWVITDSHFFERDRLGRLVAALEASGQRLGIGVGEDACVEIDLSSGVMTGITGSESLLVDVAQLLRDGLSRRCVVARLVGQGDRINLRARLATTLATIPNRTAQPARDVPIVEPGQNRQLASWRLFRHVRTAGSGPVQIQFEQWRAVAWPAANGEIAFDLEPQ